MAEPARRVYVDFDDVLCETARGLSELLEAEHGRKVPYERMRWFDLGRSFGLTAPELERFMEAAHRPENVLGLRPVDGARDVLAGWKSRGCEICVVTGRPPSTAEASRGWLAAHGVPYDSLFFVDKYRRLAPGPAGPDLLPLDALPGMGFLFAVDDAPVMLEYLARSVPVPVFIYDRPWNAEFRPGPRPGGPVLRCASWEEIGRRADELLT